MCWRLRGDNSVEGIIYRSTDRTYKDGDKMIFMNITLTHFRYNEGFWPDHYLMKTQTGQYFMLHSIEQIV